jgi:hypothetical protein
MARAITQGAPVQGAVRVYKLVPSTVDDAITTARDLLVAKGWSVIERDWYINPVSTAYLMVTLWAVPPRRKVVQA